MGDDFEMGGAGYPFTNYEYVLSLYALLKTFALFHRELSYIILSKMESFLDFDWKISTTNAIAKLINSIQVMY